MENVSISLVGRTTMNGWLFSCSILNYHRRLLTRKTLENRALPASDLIFPSFREWIVFCRRIHIGKMFKEDDKTQIFSLLHSGWFVKFMKINFMAKWNVTFHAVQHIYFFSISKATTTMIERWQQHDNGGKISISSLNFNRLHSIIACLLSLARREQMKPWQTLHIARAKSSWAY